MSEQEIEVEQIEHTRRPERSVFRIHSFYDKESIALTDQGMRELLDWLLLHAGEFDQYAALLTATEEAQATRQAIGAEVSELANADEEDETPDDWEPRAR